MDLFYKGHKFTIEGTGVVGGVRITHNGKTHVVARRATWEGSAFSDLHGVADELKKLIDNGEFKTIKQIQEHKF